MDKESKRFLVTPDIALDIMDEADTDPLMYAKEVMQKAKENHPILYKYYAEEAKKQGECWDKYTISTSLSYEIVTRQMEADGNSVEITPEDISRHKESIDFVFNDPRWKDMDWIIGRVTIREGASADSGLGLFLNILDISAPELGEEIASITEKLEEIEDMKIFVRGIYDGFMPLYRKITQQAEMG